MFEFIKNFFKRLFKKDKQLNEGKFEKEETVEPVVENTNINNSDNLVEENNNDNNTQTKEVNADLPPIDNNTDMFEYMNDLVKSSKNYNKFVETNKELDKVKKEYKEVINNIKNANS